MARDLGPLLPSRFGRSAGTKRLDDGDRFFRLVQTHRVVAAAGRLDLEGWARAEDDSAPVERQGFRPRGDGVCALDRIQSRCRRREGRFADVGTYTRAVIALILGSAGVLKLDGGSYARQPSGQGLVDKGRS